MNEALLISNGILWVVVIALGVAVFALARQVGVLYERVAPAGALALAKSVRSGDTAPELTAQTLTGEWLQIGGTRTDDRSTLLFFLSPNCPICKELLPIVQHVARAERRWLDVIFASDGTEDHAAFVQRESLGQFPYVLSEELGRAYGVSKLPFAALIDATGTIAALGIVNSREHIESLFEAHERGVPSLQAYLAQEAKDDRREVA